MKNIGFWAMVALCLAACGEAVPQNLGSIRVTTPMYTAAQTDERIVELAPNPGNYETVSNRAMESVQSEDLGSDIEALLDDGLIDYFNDWLPIALENIDEYEPRYYKINQPFYWTNKTFEVILEGDRISKLTLSYVGEYGLLLDEYGMTLTGPLVAKSTHDVNSLWDLTGLYELDLPRYIYAGLPDDTRYIDLWSLATTNDLPQVVAPTTNAVASQAADAKATGTALYTGFTEWEFSGGMQSGVVYTIDIVPEDGYFVYVLYADGTNIDAYSYATNDRLDAEFEATGITATRHLITPTKTSQLANNGDGTYPFATTNQMPDTTLTPLYGGDGNEFTPWVAHALSGQEVTIVLEDAKWVPYVDGVSVANGKEDIGQTNLQWNSSATTIGTLIFASRDKNTITAYTLGDQTNSLLSSVEFVTTEILNAHHLKLTQDSSGNYTAIVTGTRPKPHDFGALSLSGASSGFANGFGSLAFGDSVIAQGDYSVALGEGTISAESWTNIYYGHNPHKYAFVWDGNVQDDWYFSHGDGTFNICPVGGLSGFWIGETNAQGHIESIVEKTSNNIVTIIGQFSKDVTDGRLKVKQIFTEDGQTYLDATGVLHRITVIGGNSLTMSNAVGIAGYTVTYTNIPNAQIPAFQVENAAGTYESAVRDSFGLVAWSSAQSKWLGFSEHTTLSYLITNYGEDLSGALYSNFTSINVTSPLTTEFEFGMSPAYWPCYIPQGETTTSIVNTVLFSDLGNTKIVGSLAQGHDNVASGQYSHAEGTNTIASGRYAHAEGYRTTASGAASKASGLYTKSISRASIALGTNANATNNFTFVWNTEETGPTGANYGSHGAGTFNINPKGGIAGFFIGEDNLHTAFYNALTSSSPVQVTKDYEQEDGTTNTVTTTIPSLREAVENVSAAVVLKPSDPLCGWSLPEYVSALQKYEWDPKAQVCYRREVTNDYIILKAVTNIDLTAAGNLSALKAYEDSIAVRKPPQVTGGYTVGYPSDSDKIVVSGGDYRLEGDYLDGASVRITYEVSGTPTTETIPDSAITTTADTLTIASSALANARSNGGTVTFSIQTAYGSTTATAVVASISP